MSLVRCRTCGEVGVSVARYCQGCGRELPEPRADEAPLPTEAQREARQDVSAANFVFVAVGVMILGAGGVYLSLDMGWPPAVSFILGALVFVAFVVVLKSQADPHVGKRQVARTLVNFGKAIFKVIVVISIVGVVIVVGLAVFLYVACMTLSSF